MSERHPTLGTTNYLPAAVKKTPVQRFLEHRWPTTSGISFADRESTMSPSDRPQGVWNPISYGSLSQWGEPPVQGVAGMITGQASAHIKRKVTPYRKPCHPSQHKDLLPHKTTQGPKQPKSEYTMRNGSLPMGSQFMGKGLEWTVPTWSHPHQQHHPCIWLNLQYHPCRNDDHTRCRLNTRPGRQWHRSSNCLTCPQAPVLGKIAVGSVTYTTGGSTEPAQTTRIRGFQQESA